MKVYPKSQSTRNSDPTPIPGPAAEPRSDRPRRGTFDLALINKLTAIAAAGDPQRQAVYRWQVAVLGALNREPWLGADENDWSVVRKMVRLIQQALEEVEDSLDVMCELHPAPDDSDPARSPPALPGIDTKH